MSAEAEASDPLKVLIVEDELLLAMDLESEIEALGQTVVGLAAHAKQAMAIAESASPDLALVDVNLRDGLTGPQIASNLVQQHKAVVVFVTSSMEQIPPDYAGAHGVISKPWTSKTMKDLIAFVDRLLHQSSPTLKPPALMKLATSRTFPEGN